MTFEREMGKKNEEKNLIIHKVQFFCSTRSPAQKKLENKN
jgi:hypothetical protein